MNYDGLYAKYIDYFNTSLDKCFNNLSASAPSKIKDAMKYAVLDGGKRVRPVLCFAVCEMLGKSLRDVENFAIAIECIHSYSLVHDDLPAMDNDDYRRGKLSTHKKFGESYGILAGDALLNYAFELILSKDNFSSLDVKAARILAEYAGYSGMIAGQVLDLQNEKNKNLDVDTLYSIYLNKTAKLLTAPLLISSEICGGKYFENLKEYGENLGVLFQIIDDIMDVEGVFALIGKTPHKDEKEDKLTSIKIFGIDGAKIKAKEHYEKAVNAIRDIPNNEFLSAFAEKMFTRKK